MKRGDSLDIVNCAADESIQVPVNEYCNTVFLEYRFAVRNSVVGVTGRYGPIECQSRESARQRLLVGGEQSC